MKIYENALAFIGALGAISKPIKLKYAGKDKSIRRHKVRDTRQFSHKLLTLPTNGILLFDQG